MNRQTGDITLNSPLVVVLTGGIASGKSAVSSIFQNLDVPVIDTDVIARNLVQRGKPALNAIVKKFGEDFLMPDGNLDRAKMREHVFSDSSARAELEGLLHPVIREEARRQVSLVREPYCILVIPLFSESTGYDWIDRVLVVDVDPQTQKNRVMHRDGIDEKQASSIISAQASRERRLAIADDVIDNSGPIEDLESRVQKLHENYLDLALQKSE